jgi:soluble lytic murein transglycosylase-like protein
MAELEQLEVLTTAAIIALIQAKAIEHDVDPLLLQAICKVESNFNPWAIRYEPDYRYTINPMDWGHKLGITPQSEEFLQKSSLGLCQVMGALARELGHSDHLSQLFIPALNLNYACKYLKRQMKRFQKQDQLISSYNAGTPRWNHGESRWENQVYVNKVQAEMQRIRDLSAQSKP